VASQRRGSHRRITGYRTFDDKLFEAVETEAKAYLLGWLASDGSITKNTVSLVIHRKDEATLRTLRDIACPDLPIRAKTRTPLVGFTLDSVAIASDVCRWLEIEPGRKRKIVRFPALPKETLRWAFLRGFFDGDGSISSIDAAYRRSNGAWPGPRCSVASTSAQMLDAIQELARVPCHRHAGGLEWSGVNAIDFLGKLYRRSDGLRLTRKFELYLDWCCWMPALGGSASGRHPLFRWAKTHTAAVPPSKAAASDSGFDLTLIEQQGRHGEVVFYRTGIKVQPAFGWYFDLVPRSSISKSGYVLANSVGVIDRAYTGEILVPLIKLDPNAPDLALPARIVQIIPRPIIAAEIVEVDDFDTTLRGDGGFGSTG